jgi:hypothetical protein
MRDRETGRKQRDDEPSQAAWSEQLLRAGDKPARASFAGSELLSGADAAQILHKIAPADPLGIAARCGARLHARAQLIAHERAVARSLAQTAYAAVRYRGQPELGAWLDAQIDRALDTLLNDDREDEAAGRPTDEPWDPRFAFVSEVWGVSPALARRACVVFNALPIVVRQAWWALTVQGKSINRYVAEGSGPPPLVEARVKRAILAMSKLEDPGGDDPLDQEDPHA